MLNQLAKEIHAAMREKGFWDFPRDRWDTLFLMAGELMEAHEAHRKGYEADWEEYDSDEAKEKYEFNDRFEGYIKDSVGDELADAKIRILDYLGSTDFDIDGCIAEISFLTWHSEVFGGMLFEASQEIHDGEQDIFLRLCRAIHRIDHIAANFNIPLDRHITEKMAYNATRPYKHGKKY